MINRIRDIRKQKGLTLADVKAAAANPPTPSAAPALLPATSRLAPPPTGIMRILLFVLRVERSAGGERERSRRGFRCARASRAGPRGHS